MDKPICPACGRPAVEAWTLFTHLEFKCGVCPWSVTIPNETASRKVWNRLIHRAANRLFGVYGFAFSAADMTRWTTQDNPQLGWDFLVDMLTQAAVQRAGLAAVVPLAEWRAARIEAEAAEWAELRGWLWAAFGPIARQEAA